MSEQRLGKSLQEVNEEITNIRRVYNDKKEPTYYPPKPSFSALSNQEKREQLFGKFNYEILPNGMDIKITGNWIQENITDVTIPQLKQLTLSKTGKIYFHKNYTDRIQELFSIWEENNLINKILTWDGSFVTRLVRGSKTVVSNHSWGTAFDINVKWNYMGCTPASIDQQGCILELVEYANKLGFYWGGHFKRLDGMHFEIAY